MESSTAEFLIAVFAFARGSNKIVCVYKSKRTVFCLLRSQGPFSRQSFASCDR